MWENVVHPARVGYAANFVCRREVFQASGGFDTRLGPGSRFPGAEDMDLGYRLLKSGYRIASTPGFEIVHEQWREPNDLPRLFYGYNLGGAAFCAKHLRSGDLRPAAVPARPDGRGRAHGSERGEAAVEGARAGRRRPHGGDVERARPRAQEARRRVCARPRYFPRIPAIRR